MSATVPADMMAIVIPELYAVTTHCRPASPTLKSDWMAATRRHDQRVQIDHEEAEARGCEGEALRLGHRAFKVSHRQEFRPAPSRLDRPRNYDVQVLA
jgi:hypothetical protein